MKYCPKCDVNVHHQLTNCPLCGSYLDGKFDNDNCPTYSDMDDKISYPILKNKGRPSFFKSKLSIILLALTVICVVLNVLINPQSHWSAYVAIGFVFAVGCVIFPVANKLRMLKQVRYDVVLLTVVAIALELSIENGAFAWVTVEYVIPWFYVVSIILIDFLIFFQRYNNRHLFSTLLYVTVFAVLPQTVLWIARWRGWYEFKTLINFVIFFASLVNLAIVFIIYSRQMKEDMERNLNV